MGTPTDSDWGTVSVRWLPQNTMSRRDERVTLEKEPKRSTVGEDLGWKGVKS